MAVLPAQLQGAFLPTFGLQQQAPPPSYSSTITEDMIKDPARPTMSSPMSREKYYNDIFKPSVGGDAGIMSFFPSGGRGHGQVDGSPRMPSFEQFMAGQTTFSHRHDGKVYSTNAIRDTAGTFNNSYNSYVANINANNAQAQRNYEQEVAFTNAVRGIRDAAGVQKLDSRQLSQALSNLNAQRNYGASQFSTRLNFQVSDQDIISEYNSAILNRLNGIVAAGNAQVVGIQDRITAARNLVSTLPASDARRRASDDAIASMTADLQSVNQAIAEATQKIANYQPLTATSPEGLKEISGFREFIKLPDERALDQITQIDPDTVRSASLLGQRYRDMAMQDIPSTLDAATQADRRALQAGFARRAGEDYGSQVDPNTLAFRREVENQIRAKANENIPSFLDPQTEALRGQLEDETLNQLRLGTLLDADTQRSLQQATRGAQTARGNIFGVGPAAQEAMETGYAGEARAAQRRAAAQSFLGSGQTRSDASSLDRQLIEATRRNRLGDAYSFFSSGQSAEDVLGRDRQLRDQMNRQRGMDFANFLASGVTAEDAARNDLGFRNQLQLARMGAASNFIAAGPSLYNLSQARTAGQQNAFQNYINANQANPGQFNPQTFQQPFYQTTSPQIPVDLTQTAASIYNTMQNAQASMYGSQVGAISSSYRSPAQAFGSIAGGFGSIFGSLFPKGF